MFVRAVSASAAGVSKEQTVVYCTYREFGMSASRIGGHRVVDTYGSLGPQKASSAVVVCYERTGRHTDAGHERVRGILAEKAGRHQEAAWLGNQA